MSIFKNSKFTQKIYFNGKRYCTVMLNNKVYFRDGTIEEMHPVGGRIYWVDTSATGATYKFYDKNRELINLSEEEKLDVNKLGTAKYWSATGLDSKARYYVVATTADGDPEGNIAVGSALHFSISNSYTVGATDYNNGQWNMQQAYKTVILQSGNTIFKECKNNFIDKNYGMCNDWYIPAVNQDSRLKASAVNDGAKIATTQHWSSTENSTWGRAWTTYPGSWQYYGMNKGGNYFRYFITRQFGAIDKFVDSVTGKSYYQIDGISTGNSTSAMPTQYINPDYSINANTKIDITYKWNIIDSHDQCLFGANNRYNYNMFGLCIQADGEAIHNKVRWYGNSTATRYYAEANVKYRFVATKTNIQWINMDEGTFENANTTDSYTGKLLLFASNTRSSWGHTSRSTIYTCKLSEGSELKRDFVSVKCVEDGELGLFDKVENKFYANAGTGTFVEG